MNIFARGLIVNQTVIMLCLRLMTVAAAPATRTPVRPVVIKFVADWFVTAESLDEHMSVTPPPTITTNARF